MGGGVGLVPGTTRRSPAAPQPRWYSTGPGAGLTRYFYTGTVLRTHEVLATYLGAFVILTLPTRNENATRELDKAFVPFLSIKGAN